MDTRDVHVTRMPSVLRAALIGAGLAAAWFLASTAMGASSATAAEADAVGLRRLGSIVSTAVAGVGETASAVGDLLASEPVTAVVQPTAGAVDSIATTTLENFPLVGDTVVATTGPAPTGALLAPIAAVLDTALGTTGRVADGAGGAIDDLLDVGDGALRTPVPHITADAEPAAPSSGFALLSPLESAQGPYEAFVAVAATSEASTPAAPGRHLPLGMRTFDEHAGAATASGAGASVPPMIDARSADDLGGLPNGALGGDFDELLPASQTYDTDSSPD